MSEKNRCFVICPIGEEGSPVRLHSDDVLELIIEPALEIFDFDVIRADRIAGSTSITEDMLSLIQQAELCIVDLTGHNANVFYECVRARLVKQALKFGDLFWSLRRRSILSATLRRLWLRCHALLIELSAP